MTAAAASGIASRSRARAALAWVAAAITGGILLHVDRSPAWVSALGLALVAWRVLADLARVPLPPRLLRSAIALGLVALTWLAFGTLNGLAPGTALLVLMASVKLTETRARRDLYIGIGTALLLLLAACLDRQSLGRLPLYAAETLLCGAALAFVADATAGERVGTGPPFGAPQALGLAGRNLAVSIPVAIALFLLFPRLPGGFWAIPRGEDAVTGLSDTLTPGAIARLTASYETVFRVDFTGRLPEPEARYWRGPVLHEFDGSTWRRRAERSEPPEALQFRGPAYTYRVRLEPTGQAWWFVLDTPAGTPEGPVHLSFDQQLMAARPVREPVRYTATSYLAHRSGQLLPDSTRALDTALPRTRNPRTLELGRSLRARSGSDAGFVAAGLDLLRTGGFTYTLDPPTLGRDAVDDFLFQSRRGFCGHYASAFATLMRSGGVPARIVTGYLGGEWNPLGGYLTVRQSDAHAWTEVWLAGQGWTRIDPTAVVAPERLHRGILDLLPDAVSAPARLAHASPWLSRLLEAWDASNAWWAERVLHFDAHAQLDLLARLGIAEPDVRHLAWACVAVLLAWLGLLAWHLRPRQAAARDRLARAYVRLCGKLARAGLPRAPHLGPLAYAARVTGERPELARAAVLLGQYARLRYARCSSAELPGEVASFERAVRALRLSPARAR